MIRISNCTRTGSPSHILFPTSCRQLRSFGSNYLLDQLGCVLQGLCSGTLPGRSRCFSLECLLQKKQPRELLSSTHELLLGHQNNCTALKNGRDLSEADAEENRVGKKKGSLMTGENCGKQEGSVLIMLSALDMFSENSSFVQSLIKYLP